jgi:prepilin-type N-terminal cleavage/methylation domain-containing protein
MTTHTSIPRRRGGFSLAEMLIALTVMGIVLALTVPRMSKVIQGSKLTRIMDELVGDINKARMLAVRKGKSASIIVNANGLGYKMVVGTDTMRSFVLNNQEANTRFAPASATITFNSRGMITAGGGTTGTTLRAVHGTDSASVTVTGIGRVYREY